MSKAVQPDSWSQAGDTGTFFPEQVLRCCFSFTVPGGRDVVTLRWGQWIQTVLWPLPPKYRELFTSDPRCSELVSLCTVCTSWTRLLKKENVKRDVLFDELTGEAVLQHFSFLAELQAFTELVSKVFEEFFNGDHRVLYFGLGCFQTTVILKWQWKCPHSHRLQDITRPSDPCPLRLGC